MKKHHVRGETRQIILYFVLANMYDRVEVITLAFKNVMNLHLQMLDTKLSNDIGLLNRYCRSYLKQS